MMLTAALVLVVPTAGAGAQDWPMWRGPDFDGIRHETDWSADWPTTGPPVLWEKELGPGASTFIVVDGRLYTASNQNDEDIIWCLDPQTGEKIWDFRYRCPLSPRSFEGGPAATPCVDEGYLYSISHEGDLLCLDAATGEEIWRQHFIQDYNGRRPRWGYAASPIVVGDKLIIEPGGPDYAVVALDKRTGKVIWHNGDDKPSYATPIVFTHDNQQYIANFNAFGLVIHRLDNGAEVARYQWKTAHDINSATPIYHDGLIYISSGYNHGCALLRFDGQSLAEIYTNKNMAAHMNPGVLHEGHVYGVHGNAGPRATLVCMELRTGEVKWEHRGLGCGSLMLAGERLVVLSERGELVVAPATPDAFNALAEAQVLADRCWVVPLLYNGRIYCKDNSGRTICLDVRDKAIAANSATNR
jgi:outer membrane protein assembly factor BamB